MELAEGALVERERLILKAIEDRRLITFSLGDCPRVAEPHDYGIIKGQRRLFFYQVGGRSRSKEPTGWRWADLGEVSDLAVLEDHFAGERPSPSGRHYRWDKILASVAKP